MKGRIIHQFHPAFADYSRLRPSRSVTALAWRPQRPGSTANGINGTSSRLDEMQLAIASEDSSLRLLSVELSP